MFVQLVPVSAIVSRQSCCNYPHIDFFTFVDFVMTPVILATLTI